MSDLRKPFRAPAVVLGDRYREIERRNRIRATIKSLALGGALASAVFVAGMAVTRPDLVKRYSPGTVAFLVPHQDKVVSGASVYYPNCRSAWAAGEAPIKAGSPGYRPELDRDGDGVACEPYRP